MIQDDRKVKPIKLTNSKAYLPHNLFFVGQIQLSSSPATRLPLERETREREKEEDEVERERGDGYLGELLESFFSVRFFFSVYLLYGEVKSVGKWVYCEINFYALI